MPTFERHWFQGTIVDPAERYRCSIFDAIAAVSTLFTAGATDLAATGGLYAAEGAADIGTGLETTGGLYGTGEALTGAGDVLGGSTGLLSTAGDVLGGTTSSLTTALEPLTAAPLSVTPAATTVSTALPAGTSVGGALAPAEAVPASVGAASPTATGELSGTLGTGGLYGTTGATSGDLSGTLGTGGLYSTPGTTGATSGGGGLTSGLDNVLKSATGGALNLKDLGTIGSIGGLGMNLLNANQPIPGQKQLNQAAGSLTATAEAQANEGRTLENYLQSGTLPPGIQSGLTSATQAAEASIRAQHASRGTSGSSAEAQDIQNAQDRAVSAGQSIALQLLQQGATMTGMAVNTESLAANLYSEIMKEALAQDQQLGSAIGNFASAMAGGGSRTGGVTINTTAAS